ncbi:MAG: RnfABCDGE type electron transport complex subunit D [Planctomycetota bacterium]|jgi:electron transport complex protein RnfD
MTAADEHPAPRTPFDFYRRLPSPRAPFLRAPEAVSTIFLVTMAAAFGPLLAGGVFFGWRAIYLAGLSMGSCAAIEWLYVRVTRTPALLGRSHAVLTGLLLALTLPPFAGWHVAVVGAAFAIIVGKGIFGGVGHFVWQPALVGRLAVAVMFPALVAGPSQMDQGHWPILAPNKVIIGDVADTETIDSYLRWRDQRAARGTDALLVTRPEGRLAPLTRGEPAFSALARVPRDVQRPLPPALLGLPSLNDMFIGATPGAIGETCTVIILVAGLYLVYRNFIRWQLPASIVLAAAVTVSVAPVQLVADTDITAWWPIAREGLDVGVVYLAYHLTSGGLMLAAFFLATEMTTRPVTAGGQVLFGLGIGTIAILLRLYTNVPVPAYMAVLIMNTFTQTIDRLWRPRPLGRRWWPLSMLQREGA